ncbi:MAG: choice-of-anchor D domain-containing protein, partial [Betaproteobacteria bacterium]
MIDISTNTVVATIPASSGNFSNDGVAVHPSGSRVYVTHNGTGNAVSIVNTATNTRTGAITVTADPLGIAINPAGTLAYVTHNLGTTVTVLDTIGNTIVTTITVAANPTGVAITPDGARAYVTHSPGNTVTVISTATNTILTTVGVGTNPFGIAVNPAGTRVYVTHTNTGDVRIIDTASNTVVGTVTGGNTPYGVAVSPDGSKVYQSDSGANTVRVINTGTNTVTATINVGLSPQGIAVTADGSRVLAVNNASNDVSVIDTGSNTVIATVPVGSSPRAFGLFIGGPASVPGAPIIGAATPGNGQATISFAAPASDGGSPITGYTATCTPGPVVGSGTGSPITVTGLGNGITYTCSVAAANAVGPGPSSGTVNVTPGVPAISIAGTTAFPNTAVGNSSGVQAITITNTGTATLSLNGITHTGPGLYPDTTGGPAPNMLHWCGFGSAATGAPLAGSPINIPPAGSCTLNLVFAPNLTGALPASITINSNAPTSPTTISLTGTGLAPNASITPPSILFGNAPVSLGVNQISTFNNPSAVPYTITSLSIAGLGFTVAPTGASPCTVGAVVNGGSSCEFTVTFTPTGTGSTNGTTTVGFQPFGAGPTYSATQSTNGNGFTPPFSVAPPSVAFGNVPVGNTVTQNFTFTNDSNTTAFPSTYTITSFSTTGLGFSAVGSGATPCAVSLTLAPGTSCGVTFTLVPAAVGSTNGTTIIGFLAGLGANPPYSASLGGNGNGIAVAPIITSGAPPAATVGVPYSFTFTASGTPTLTWSVATGTLPAGLALSAPGVLSGTPTAAGSSSFTVLVSNGTPPDATQGVTLNVAPAPAPAVTITGSGAFPNTVEGATSAVQAITIQNTGTANLDISAIQVSPVGMFFDTTAGLPPNAAHYCNFGSLASGAAQTGAPQTLIPGQSCTINMVFRPTSISSFNHSVSFTSNASGSPHNVALTGNGIAPAITLSPNLAFGNQEEGTTSVPQVVTLTNTSPVSITLTSALSVSPAGQFNVTPAGATPCTNGLVVPSLGSCTVNVTFAPAAISSFNFGLNASFLVVTSNLNVSSNLTGNGVAPAVSVGPNLNFGNVITGTNSAPQTVTFTNASAGAVTLTGAITASPPGQFAITPSGATPCTSGLLVPALSSCTVSVVFSPTIQSSFNYTLIAPFQVVTSNLSATSSLAGNGVSATGPYAYIANRTDNTVSVIDTPTNSVVATIPVGVNPYGVAVNPAGSRVYVSNQNASSVSVIDAASNTVVATVPVGINPLGLAVTPGGNRVYAAVAVSNAVYVIDGASNSVLTTIPVGGSPIGVAINPAGTLAYVANASSNNVSVIDTGSNAVIATVPVGTGPFGVAINPAGTFAYVANQNSGNVSVIDTASNIVVATVVTGFTPYTVAINAAGTRVFLANNANVSVIDTATNTVTTNIAVGASPRGVAFNPAGTFAYVANMSSNNVSVIDTSSNTVVATVAVGAGPLPLGQFIVPAAVSLMPVTITSPAPGGGSVAVAYSHSYSAVGTAPYNWSVLFGALPPGLALNPLTGVLSGTPTAAGVYAFSVQATNGASPVAFQNASVTIGAASAPIFSPSASSFTFASQSIASTSTAQTLTITNSGTAVMSILSPTISGPFALSGNACTGLAPAGTCSMAFTFTPVAAGAAS